MKKILYSVLALGAIATLASCSSEEPLGPNDRPNDGKVTFNICLEGTQTRAFGETTDCNEIIYTVFDMNDQVVLEDKTETAFGTGVNTATVELQLVANQQYKVIFYAHNNNSNFSSYANGVVTVNYGSENIHVNSNVDDAFINKQTYTPAGATEALPNQVFTADGNAKTVYLTRPFAQVNFGTNDLNNTAVQNILDNVSTEFTVSSGLYSTYSVLDEEATTEYTGAYTATTGKPQENTDFPVGGYSNLLSAYLLVDQAQSVINANYTIKLAGKPNINTLNLSAMPVQGNYRTNVYGSLLTTQNDFNVTIVPGFDDEININKSPVEVTSEADFIKVASDPNSFGVSVPENTVLDFSAYPEMMLTHDFTIINNGQIKLAANSFVNRKANLVIKGNGTVTGPYALITNQSGTVTIDGGRFITTNASTDPMPGRSTIIYTGQWQGPAEENYPLYQDGSVIINDGYFESEGYYVVNSNYGDELTINGGTFIAKCKGAWTDYVIQAEGVKNVNINGGTYFGDWGGIRVGTSSGQAKKNVFTMTAGTIVVTNSRNQNAQHCVVADAESYQGGTIVNVSGGNFYTAGTSGQCIVVGGSNRTPATITGGFYNKSVTPSEGYTLISNANKNISVQGNTYLLNFEVKAK